MTPTSTVPAAFGGVVKVICVSSTIMNEPASNVLVPMETAVAPVKCEPVMVTLVPPVAGPVLGVREEIEGAMLPAGVTGPNSSTYT